MRRKTIAQDWISQEIQNSTLQRGARATGEGGVRARLVVFMNRIWYH
jgi:hypothetical protein